MSKPVVYYKRSANRSEFFLIHISFIWTGSLLVPTNIVYQSLPDSWWWIGRQVHVTLQVLIPITQPRPISSMPDVHTFYSSIYMHTHIIKIQNQDFTSSDIKSLLSSPFALWSSSSFSAIPWSFVCPVLWMLSIFFDDQTHLESK